MDVVNRYIPNEVGTYNTGSTGGLYYGGGNIKAGLIKNFILESIPNAIVLSDNNPNDWYDVAKVIDIAITNQFVINLTSLYHTNTTPYGRVACTLKGPNMNGPLGISYFTSGYISFYENIDFFGLGRLCVETFMINKQRKMLFSYLMLHSFYQIRTSVCVAVMIASYGM